MKYAFALLTLGAAACATMPVGGASAPAGSHSLPSTPIELGDWRHASAAATLSQFESAVEARYGQGIAISAAVADLRRNSFNCSVNNDPNSRGDPPAQICRKTVTADACTSTWQVHLFGAAGQLDHARALYDRRCGGDGLLGGPG
jgi:hypothetical protein